MPKPLIIKRIAVSTIFFVVGFQYANWVARIPELQQLYNIDNATLGTILLISAGGAIIAMPFTGVITHYFSTRQITVALALLQCGFVPFLPLSASFWHVAFLFLVLGITSGAVDVTMNGQAVQLEKQWQKPIISSFHAVFSIGMALGAGSGALFAKWGVDLFLHLSLIAGFNVFLVLSAMRHLLPDEGQKGSVTEPVPVQSVGGQFRLPTKAILPLGIIAFCGMTGEGTMADWSALYMFKVIGENESTAAFAFFSFAAAMTVGRVFGDYFTILLGKRRLLVANSLLAIIGLSLSLLILEKWIVVFGFFLVGLGLATIVPIIYSTAGNTEGVKPSVGIAMATTIGYAGFFVGPPVIGYLSDWYDLRAGLFFALLLLVVMLIFVVKYRFKEGE